MKEQEISKVYAESINQIASEKSVDVVSEIAKVADLLNKSNQLEQLLFLDTFESEDKVSVFNELAEKVNLHPLVSNFMVYLIEEKRVNLFNQIYKEIVSIDDREKGFLSGVIEGSQGQVDENFKNKIGAYLNKRLGKQVNFSYEKNEKVTAGYRVKVDDLLLDASLESQLEQFKKTIMI